MAGSEHISTLGVSNIPNRDQIFKNADAWLNDKREIDGAEGLWRIYDDLYDFTDFIKKHPGGTFWLDVTKGTDITEAFECHHVSLLPETLLGKYFVRKAKAPRNSPFTFEENGFYKTLKRNVREVLKTVPRSAKVKSELYADGLVITTFAFSTLAAAYGSYLLGIVSGILLASTVTSAHNFYHQKDSFRMYYSDIGLMKSRDWRIIHILSHHIVPNSVADMQAYIIEPMANVFPEKKSLCIKYATWIYTPLIMWPTFFYFIFFVRMYQWIFDGYNQSIGKSEFLALLLPATMYTFSGKPLTSIIIMWLLIVAVHGFFFSLIGYATGHYHPDIFIDGDAARPERDWGINQLDTVGDKHEVTGSQFLVLITFGDHALHHLFPTLDHGVLQYLYPIAEKTAKEFNINIRMTTLADLIKGFFQNLAKEKPNPNPPNMLKQYVQ